MRRGKKIPLPYSKKLIYDKGDSYSNIGSLVAKYTCFDIFC
ncbi:hypothetical protein BMQ_pBM50094 (plasmid) [Priestia megaterium QM B1551]|uniref:Uncharacterized protein n=1 Tax=Priestia megaterium (strain ATCC 12872 / QMB1551) TaxID=545693 RepID=D5E3Q8_PRIM1|nr:hypothetical protein BMQ_pBM50094 [Priestia megaterium QM B1551]